MSLKAYEDACTRAELFGQPKPDREEFLAQHKHLDVVEFEEVDIKTAENTAMLDEQMQEASGGLQELNTILTSTQTKINKLKGVCGSLTNFFRVKLTARDNLSYSSEPSYVGQTNYDKDYVPPQSTDIESINQGLGPNDNEMTVKQHGGRAQDGRRAQCGGGMTAAMQALDEIEKMENTSIASKATVHDIGKQVTSQVSKLDQMITQADRAQASMSHQNKQMRSFIR